MISLLTLFTSGIYAMDSGKNYFGHPTANMGMTISLLGDKLSLFGTKGALKFVKDDPDKDVGKLFFNEKQVCINDGDLELCKGKESENKSKLRVKRKDKGYRIKNVVTNQIKKQFSEVCLTVKGLYLKMKKCQDNFEPQIFLFELLNAPINSMPGSTGGCNCNKMNPGPGMPQQPSNGPQQSPNNPQQPCIPLPGSNSLDALPFSSTQGSNNPAGLELPPIYRPNPKSPNSGMFSNALAEVHENNNPIFR